MARFSFGFGSIRRILAAAAALALLAVPGAVLADGNVTVGDVDGKGKVGIGGDGENNDITITQSGNTITITGNNGTTINGMASVMRDATKLDIVMMGGNDTVTIDGVNVRKIKINDQDGNNTTTVTNSTIARKLEIQHGSGNDTVNVTSTSRGTTNIDTDGGNDTVNDSNGSSKVSTISTGKGLDWVNLMNLDIQTQNVNLGRGDDQLYVGGSSFFKANFIGRQGEDCFNEDGWNSFNGLPFCQSDFHSLSWKDLLQNLFHGDGKFPDSQCRLKGFTMDYCVW